MTSDEIDKKLEQLISTEKSSWLEDAQFRADNRKWLKRSQAVAILVIKALRSQGLNEKVLAERMGVSSRLVNRWLKGKENFTFETIAKLEDALGIELMNVVGEDWNMAKKKKVVEKKVVVPDNPEYNTITTAIKDSILAGEPEVHFKKSRKKV